MNKRSLATGMLVSTLRIGFVATVIVASFASRSEAQTFQPTGAGSYAWTLSSNWSPATVPNAIGATATLGGTSAVDKTLTFGQTITVGTIAFTGTDRYTLADGGGSLVLDATGGGTAVISIASGAGSQTISAGITVDATDNFQVTNNSSTGTLFLGALTMSSGKTLSLQGTPTTTISALTFSGSATIFNNTSLVTPGDLQIGTVFGSANLTFSGSGTGTTARTIIGGGSIGNVVLAAGNLQFTSTPTALGNLTFSGSGSSLEIGNGVTLGSGSTFTLSTAAGTRTIAAVGTNATLAATVSLSGTATYTNLLVSAATGQTLTISGAINNGTALTGFTKIGGGTLVLSNSSNTFSALGVGTLAVSGYGGTVRAEANQIMRNSSGTGLNLATINIFSGKFDQNGKQLTISGINFVTSFATTSLDASTRPVFDLNGGTLTLQQAAGVIGYSTPSGGPASAVPLGGLLTDSAGTGVIRFDVGVGVVPQINIVGHKTTVVGQSDVDLEIAASISTDAGLRLTYSVTNTLGGTLLLSGNNTISGGIFIATNTSNSHILRFSSQQALGGAANGITIDNGGSLEAAVDNLTIGNNITYSSLGSGLTSTNTKLVRLKTGLTAGTYTGVFTLSNSAAGNSGFSVIDAAAMMTVSGQITGAAGSGLMKQGAGTLLLSNTGSDFTGGVTVSAGILAISGNVTTSGNSAIGTGSTITLASGTSLVYGGTGGTFQRTASYAAAGTLGAIGSANGTFAGTINVGGALTISNVSSGGLTISSNLAMGVNLLTVTGSGTTTISGIIGGSNVLTKYASGVLVLSGANTYSGVTNVGGGGANSYGGTIRAGANNVLATGGAMSLSSGVYDLNGFNQTLLSLTFNGSSAATNSAQRAMLDLKGGTLTLTNLAYNAANSPTVHPLITNSGVGGYVSLPGASTITIGNSASLPIDLEIAASISSSGSITFASNSAGTFNGNATVVKLSAANTISGPISIGTGGNGLTVIVAHNNAFGTTNTVTAVSTGISQIDLVNGITLPVGITLNMGEGVTATAKMITVQSTSANATILGNIAFATNNATTYGGMFDVAASSNLTVSGVISQTGSIMTKRGAGVLYLVNDGNTFGSANTTLRIMEGTIAFTSVSNGASSSALGSAAGSTATLRPLLMGTDTTSAGLMFIGSTNQTMSRYLNIAGIGATFDASGTSGATFALDQTSANLVSSDITQSTPPLTYAANFAKTVTLTGTGTGLITSASLPEYSGSAKTSMVKSGTGTWIISAAQTYSGDTTIAAGILQLNASLASPNVTISGGSLRGTGTVNGTTTLAGGTISFASGGNIANALNVITGGNWNGVGSANSVSVSSGTLTVGSGATLSTGGMSVASVLNVLGTITSSANTFSGTVNGSGTIYGASTLSGGTISFASGGNIANALNVVSGGTWNGVGSVGGNVTVSGGTFNVNSALTSGGVYVTGGTLAGNSTVNGSVTTLSGGTISFASGGNIAGALNVVSGGSWNGVGSASSVSVSSGTFTVGSGATLSTSAINVASTLHLLGTVTGPATISGNLNGSGTLAGTTTLTGGTISFASGGNLAGALNVTSGGTWSGGGSASSVSVSSGTFTVGSGATLSTGEITVGSTLHLLGTITGGANITGLVNGGGAIHGNSTLTGGTISFSPTGQIVGTLATTGGTWNGGGNVSAVNQTGGTFDLVNGASMGVGTFNVNGGQLNANGSIVGDVTVAGGTLGGSGIISGTVTVNSGDLSPGNSPGLLTIADLDMNGGNYVWELASLTTSGGGTNFDLVVVDGGDADLSNTAEVVLDFSLLPTLEQPGPDDAFWLTDQQWVILNVIGGGTVNGTFADLNEFVDLGVYGSGLFSLAYDSTNVYLNYNFTAVPEPASLLLASLGALTLGGMGYRRRKSLRS